MPTAPAPCRRAVRAGVTRAACLAALLPALTAAAAALPARNGVFCADGGDTVTVDGGRDLVEIGGYTCRHPVIAADKLQSIECRRGSSAPERREFDFRLVDPRNLIMNRRWYVLCRPVPAAP